VIGIKGTKDEAERIFKEIEIVLSKIGLTLSRTKTRITNINDQGFLFLGTFIFRARRISFARLAGALIKRNSKKLRLEAPLIRIMKKLHEADFMKAGKSNPKFIWLSLEHRQIIHLYNSVLRGYLNYYKFTHNYGKLTSSLVYILKSSCAKLLAAKYSLGTEAKVYRKFGPQLAVPITEKGKVKIHGFLKPSYVLTMKFLTNSTPIIKSLYGSKSLATLDDMVCSICGSEYRVEMHHVRALKDLNPKLSTIDKLMASRRRKQIALCRECHMKKHHN